tara:strand:- start:173 stop:322 length:150 start_codon:yes stop_codon:yes gene_type:complete
MRKSLILLVFLGSLTACSDRTRVNCERVKNKALSAATIAPNETGTGRCA